MDFFTNNNRTFLLSLDSGSEANSKNNLTSSLFTICTNSFKADISDSVKSF